MDSHFTKTWSNNQTSNQPRYPDEITDFINESSSKKNSLSLGKNMLYANLPLGLYTNLLILNQSTGLDAYILYPNQWTYTCVFNDLIDYPFVTMSNETTLKQSYFCSGKTASVNLFLSNMKISCKECNTLDSSTARLIEVIKFKQATPWSEDTSKNKKNGYFYLRSAYLLLQKYFVNQNNWYYYSWAVYPFLQK